MFSSSLSWISCESIQLGLIFRSNHSDRQVSRHFFRWTKEIAYAEYYERALTNGILGIQRGREPGVMIYMLPLGRDVSKAVSYRGWGTKFDSFWCCYGIGIELFSKLGDSIDFEEEGKVPGIYITQFISTSQSGQILLNQKVEPPVAWNSLFQVFLTILSEEEGSGLQATLHFRVPLWSLLNGAKAVLNVQDLSLPNPAASTWGGFQKQHRQLCNKYDWIC